MLKKEFLKMEKILTDEFSPIGRGAGNDWIRCTDRFQLDRLMKSQIQK